MRRILTASCLLAALLATTASFAQQQQPAIPAVAVQEEKPAFSFEIKADKEDAVYKCGEKAKFKVKLLDSTGKSFSGANFTCVITGDWGLSKKVDLTSAANSPCIVEATLDKPGFILCKASYKPEGAQKPYEALAGAAFDPFQIKSQRPEPADFDAFWAKAKEELAAVPMKATMTPVEAGDKIDLFDVKVDCAGGMPVSGYLTKPKGAAPGSLPAYISYHGAGVRSSGKPTGLANEGFLAMDVNAHGIENGKPEEFYKDLANDSLKEYRTRDSDDPSKIYFRGMFLRVVRALEFLKSQPEWDGRNLIVFGTSQGGGQALVAAGLDPQVTFCVANVPALCFHTGNLDGQNNGWPKFIQLKDGQPVNQAVVDTVPYYDAAIFAKRIKCPAILSTGFIDTTCPPTSVYVAFNNIPGKDKRIINDIPATHKVPKETYDACGKAFRESVKKAE